MGVSHLRDNYNRGGLPASKFRKVVLLADDLADGISESLCCPQQAFRLGKKHARNQFLFRRLQGMSRQQCDRSLRRNQ